jgi:hypothetical protein
MLQNAMEQLMKKNSCLQVKNEFEKNHSTLSPMFQCQKCHVFWIKRLQEYELRDRTHRSQVSN